MSLTDLKNNGLLIQIINPLGHESWWFKKGRKLNFDTRTKYDRDGFDRWGSGVRNGALASGYHRMGGWNGQRFYRVIKRLR